LAYQLQSFDLLARQTFAVAKAIPDASADKIIFYFLMIG